MQPIVNGLESEFAEQMVFEYRDANSETGRVSMRDYGLRGHPAYVVVDSSGQVLWSATGPMSAERLREQVRKYLVMSS